MLINELFTVLLRCVSEMKVVLHSNTKENKDELGTIRIIKMAFQRPFSHYRSKESEEFDPKVSHNRYVMKNIVSCRMTTCALS